MRRGPDGYTVAEVMLVITVSAILLLAALRIFAEQQPATAFRQSMEDLRSKIQSVAIEVTSGDFPQTAGYTCSVDTTDPLYHRPVFTAGGSGDSQACLFVGKALMLRLNISPTTLYIYPVAGLRNAQGTTDPATTFSQTNPEPAWRNTGEYLFYEVYSPGTFRVISSTISDAAGRFDIIGFYNSLSNTSTVAASEATPQLLSKAYQNVSGANLGVPNDPAVKNCIEARAPCSTIVRDFTTWTLCATDDKRYAKLIVDSGPSGIKTRLDYSTCS